MSLLEKFDNPEAERKWKAKVWKRIQDRHADLKERILETKREFGEITLLEFEEKGDV